MGGGSKWSVATNDELRRTAGDLVVVLLKMHGQHWFGLFGSIARLYAVFELSL